MNQKEQPTILENAQTEKLLAACALIKKSPAFLDGMYLYKLHFVVPLAEDNLSAYRSTTLNSLARQLVNSKKSVGGLSNRQWFCNNFPGGGFYKISLAQKAPQSYPVVHYHMYCFGKKPHLERQLQTVLAVRLKKLALSGQAGIYGGAKVTDIGACFQEIIHELEQQQYCLYLESEPVAMLGKAFRKWALTLLHGDLRFFGPLYKLLNPSEGATF